MTATKKKRQPAEPAQPRLGRPAEGLDGERRTAWLRVRVTPGELALLATWAEDGGWHGVSEYVRHECGL